MLPGGRILGRKRNRMGKDPLKKDPGADPKAKPGPHRPPWQDTIEFIQVDWDSREEWSFSSWDDDGTGVMMSRQHHDYEREGNVWESENFGTVDDWVEIYMSGGVGSIEVIQTGQ